MKSCKLTQFVARESFDSVLSRLRPIYLLGSGFSQCGSMLKNENARQESGSGNINADHHATIWAPPVPEFYSFPPLVNALRTTAKQDVASFHFPGHNRGRAAPPSLAHVIGTSPFRHDLPELPGLDNLFCPNGPISDAQSLAADLFGASDTWFLVGGSTCGIQAAVMATCSPGDTLILPRNSHLSAISAMVLCGVIPKYIIPEYSPEWDIAGGIDVGQASPLPPFLLMSRVGVMQFSFPVKMHCLAM